MRKNLTGTEPFGRLPTHPALDLFLGREVKTFETEVLTDPALMLLMSPFTAGRFHSQNGREIELTAQKVKDAGRHAGIVIEKPPVVSYDAELKSEPQPAGLAPAPQRLLSVLGGSAQSRANSSSVGSPGSSTGWRRWREVRMGAKPVAGSAIHIQPASFQILG
jgi:hypothetical protein